MKTKNLLKCFYSVFILTIFFSQFVTLKAQLNLPPIPVVPPQIKLDPIPSISNTTVKTIDLPQQAPTNVNKYYLTAEELLAPPYQISANMFIYYMAKPYTETERVAYLRGKQADLIAQLRIAGWDIAIEGLKTVLSFKNDIGYNTTASEDAQEWARDICQQLLDIAEEIEEYTHDAAKSQKEYEKRIKNIQINPTSGSYSVNVNDANIHVTTYSDPGKDITNENKTPVRKTHEEVSFPLVKVLKTVGFDKDGNPRHGWGYDVQRTVKIVEDN